MKVGSGDYVEAVTQSTFAAFIGMGASLLVLAYYLWKTGLLQHIIHRPESDNEIDTKALLWDTIREAIPFIVTGSAIQLFQIIDQMTYSNVMSWFTNFSRSELLVQFSYFSANPNKITMILIAVATSIGGVGIPLLTENYVKGDFRAAGKLVQDNLTMLVAFLLPATIGAVAIAEPLYTVFYGKPDSPSFGTLYPSDVANGHPRLVYGPFSYDPGSFPKSEGNSLLWLWSIGKTGSPSTVHLSL